MGNLRNEAKVMLSAREDLTAVVSKVGIEMSLWKWVAENGMPVSQLEIRG
jgi:hypothetical protein